MPLREASGNAFAKVNLTLDVLSKRPDGYHDIDSIMQTISLSDVITVSRGGSGLGTDLSVMALHPEGRPYPDVPRDASNLVVRAIHAVLARAGIDPAEERIRIVLEKHIPTQAGLGGGSSDAAMAMRLADKVYELGLGYRAMVEIGMSIGADVPFFLTGGTARVQGLGERITPIETSTEFRSQWIVLLKPTNGVSTANAYRSLDETRSGRTFPNEGASTRTWLDAHQTGGNLPMHNDFQSVVLSQEPDLANVQTAFDNLTREHGAPTPIISGSGSAMFTLVNDAQTAQAIMKESWQKITSGVESVYAVRLCGGGSTW
jgi:4-diphosphocytidyl-2-C-methyl-D-erythritol kinase